MEIGDNTNAELKKLESSDDIDLGLILNILIRNKKFIGIISIIFFLGSCLISISKKRVWQGQFDIVISSSVPTITNPLEFAAASSNLGANLTFSSRKLNTEIGILESQSVLMPAFEFYKKQKLKLYKNNKSNVLFKDWKKSNVKVSLKRGTTILNVSYRDKDKDLVIPVLSEISNLYQDYSGSQKKRSSELSKKFLKEQIKIYKEKSKNSFKEAQSYAIDQDLSDIDFYQKSNINSDINSALNSEVSSSSTNQNLSVTIPNIAIENARVSYANRLKNIDQQIKKIKEIGDDPYQLQYLGSTIPALVQENLPDLLSDIEENLVNLRSKYTDKQRVITRLTEERNLLTKLLKKRAIGYLEAEKIQVEAKMEATTRPKEVILIYKELVREAGRDESILIDLENQLRIMDLAEARVFDPWKLITKPTMLEYPVAPSRKTWGLIGLIFGFFVGTFISIFREKLSNLVIEPKILESKFYTKVIDRINFKKDKYGDEKISFIRELIKINLKLKTSIFSIGNINNQDKTKLKEILIGSNAKNEESKLLEINSSFEDFIKAERKILLVNLENLTYKDIRELTNRFKTLDVGINGILLINNN